MKKKKNCWEVKRCGREAGGAKVKELGTCPASMEHRLHGVHDGDHGGRACWVIVGTFCGGSEQGTFAQKYHNCEICDFYKSVKEEEGLKFKLSGLLLSKLRS